MTGPDSGPRRRDPAPAASAARSGRCTPSRASTWTRRRVRSPRWSGRTAPARPRRCWCWPRCSPRTPARSGGRLRPGHPGRPRSGPGWAGRRTSSGCTTRSPASEYLEVMAAAYRLPAERPGGRAEQLLELARLPDKAGRAGAHAVPRPEAAARAGPGAGARPGRAAAGRAGLRAGPAQPGELRDLLRRLAGEGRAVLVSSHILSDLEEVADRVVFVDARPDGRPARDRRAAGGPVGPDLPAAGARPGRAAPGAGAGRRRLGDARRARRHRRAGLGGEAAAARLLGELVAAGCRSPRSPRSAARWKPPTWTWWRAVDERERGQVRGDEERHVSGDPDRRAAGVPAADPGRAGGAGWSAPGSWCCRWSPGWSAAPPTSRTSSATLAAERTLGAVMFGVVVLVVLALALLVAPALAAQSVNGDRERGTLATLQVTRLRAGEIAVGKLARVLGHRAGLPRGHAAAGAVVLRRGRPVVVPGRRRLPGHRAAARCRLRDLARRCRRCWPAVTTSGVLAYLTVFALAAGTADHLRAGHRQHPGDGHRVLADLRRRRQLHRDPVRDDDRPAGPDLVAARAEPVRGAGRLGAGRPGAPGDPAAERAGGRGARRRRHPRLAVPGAAPGSRATPQRVDDQYGTAFARAGRRDRRPGLAARARHRPRCSRPARSG